MNKIKDDIEITKKFMTVEEAAKKFEFHPRYVRELCSKGILEASKLGRAWLILKNQKCSRRRHNNGNT